MREADVGRATFYEHYTSKDDLLRAQLRYVCTTMLRGGRDQPALIVANLTALLAWWTENGMKETAGEMQALFQSCVAAMVVQDGTLLPSDVVAFR